jgi:hypothetical protein
MVYPPLISLSRRTAYRGSVSTDRVIMYFIYIAIQIVLVLQVPVLVESRTAVTVNPYLYRYLHDDKLTVYVSFRTNMLLQILL